LSSLSSASCYIPSRACWLHSPLHEPPHPPPGASHHHLIGVTECDIQVGHGLSVVGLSADWTCKSALVFEVCHMLPVINV
jgi:hypothetical protein